MGYSEACTRKSVIATASYHCFD